MEDTLRDNAQAICRTISDSGAADVLGLSLGPECSWASFLLIGTVASRVQMHGVAAEVRREMKELDIEPGGGKKSEDASWHIIDGGSIVVSLMDREARDFYALEERWYEAEVIYGSDN